MVHPAGRFWPYVVVAIMLAIGCALPITAHAQSSPVASPIAFPVTLPDCTGGSVTFDAPPKRIVTLDAYAAEFVIDLGLGNLVVGTGFPHPEAQIPDDLKDDFAAIPNLTSGLAGDMGAMPSREAIAAAKPDLVLTTYAALVGDDSTTQISPADMAPIGAKVFASCTGTGTEIVTGIEDTYTFFNQLGAILGVPDRAAEIVTEMRERQDAITARVAGLPPTPTFTLAADPNDGQPLPTWGGAGIPNGIMVLAGCENIFGDEPTAGFFPSAEEVAARDPDVISILTDYVTEDGQSLIDDIEKNPILSGTTAVRDKRFVIVSHIISGTVSPRNLDAVEALANACHPA